MQRSEAAKKASAKEGVNYSVAPGRSGMLSFLLQDPRTLLTNVIPHRRRGLIGNEDRRVDALAGRIWTMNSTTKDCCRWI
jgi:hypothetical protein